MDSPTTSEAFAYEQLRKAIIGGQLPTDVFLSQRSLADMAGVAVVTVRATLRTLESDGLIENVPHWGVRIPSETEDTLRDRYFLRELLEVAAALRFAARAGASETTIVCELGEKCDRLAPLDSAPQVESYSQAHFNFHHFLGECAGSPLLLETLDRTFLRTQILFNKLQTYASLDAYHVSHTALAQNITSGDPPRVEQAMRQHIALGLANELQALRSHKLAESHSALEPRRDSWRRASKAKLEGPVGAERT